MALKKFCPRCGKIIDASHRYCDECQAILDEKKKQRWKNDKERHRKYKANRTDIREQRFYSGKKWQQAKDWAANKYKGMCLYSYYKYNKIVPYDTVHHIVEVKEDWDQRLNIYQIIPLTESVHQMVHKMYEKSPEDKAKMQQELRDMIAKWNGW